MCAGDARVGSGEHVRRWAPQGLWLVTGQPLILAWKVKRPQHGQKPEQSSGDAILDKSVGAQSISGN